MKINQSISGFKRLLVGCAFVIISIHVMGQEGETTTLKKSLKLGNSPTIELNLYDLSAVIMKSATNELKIELDYIADGKEEELKRLKELMESSVLTGTSGSNSATVDLTFQNNFDLEVMGMKWSKVTFKSGNKQSIKLKEFKIKRCKLWLPAQADISMNAKYSQVNIDYPVNGNFDIDLYDGRLDLKDVSGYLKGDAKYSQMKAGNFSEIDLDIYECELYAGNTGAVDLNAKYSTIKLGETKSVRLGIYEGGFSCLKTETARIENKYASINFEELGDIQLDAYEGGFEAGKINTMSLSGKYLELSLGQVGEFRMSEGYENEISFDKANTIISKDGKYNEFTIGVLTQSFIQSGYEDEVEIESISSDFQKIELTGKYVEAGLTFVNPPAYVLKGNVQYPDLNINESRYKVRTKIGDDNRLEFLFEYGNVNDSTPVINIEGYEMDISIEH
ncbi:hypothetical protein [Carboxylicivirga sp. RSCT41]|uniref:hypothetical protein n=1 Tax=Carboxylicivirga agarovorans TaxID=3417570 RepID=UPI003D3425DE